MELYKKIKARREELGMSQEELATKLGYKSRSTINKIEMGKNDITQSKIKAFAEALQTTPGYLMGYDTVSSDGVEPYNPKMHKIPVLGYIAAGLPLYADEHIDDYTYTERNGGAEYFALRIKGDSMTAANIPDKSLVIVRRQETVENGEIAAIRVNNENATVKRFKQDKNIVQLIPQSYNPEHQIQIYDLKKDKIEIIGKVVECKVEF
ncbi:MAG: LexA family transcriptional regulator [Clostridia bacterium]|nr:LexA family transcriptional regulator [Clostridia bacterium]